MLTKGVTLRGLEVFEALAATGSIALAAESTGLSQPAVSQQIKNLETALGVHLMDHSKRPMQLTQAGRSFLSRTRSVLSELRVAQSELTVMDLSHLSTLSIGVIDDFDNDLTPRLVTILAESLTKCRFKLITAGSQDVTKAIKEKRLHIGIAASTGEVMDGVIEFPLIRDPFVLVTPASHAPTQAGVERVMQDLPFLRYDRQQLISRQIDAQLSRLKLQFSDRFEIGSHLALMSCVARGIGWAITTPLGYMRATRFHDQITAHPLPFAPFSRQISLYASHDWTDSVPREVAQTVKRLAKDKMVIPAVKQLPFLDGAFTILDTTK